MVVIIKMDKSIPQTRSVSFEMCKLKTRAEGETDKFIEGYFIVYNRETELWPGYFEQVAPEALNSTLGNDIKALINHDTTLVLGRNKANTLDLKSDGHGLWGSIKINPNDSDAMNLYERVSRGDVDQCSFGFNIGNEEDDFRDDGTIHTILKEIDLWEVSVVTFPAYEETGVQARKKDIEQQRQRQLDVRKKKLKERLKNYGNKTVNAE
jgi:HK97 family phage prohead protease